MNGCFFMGTEELKTRLSRVGTNAFLRLVNYICGGSIIEPGSKPGGRDDGCGFNGGVGHRGRNGWRGFCRAFMAERYCRSVLRKIDITAFIGGFEMAK